MCVAIFVGGETEENNAGSDFNELSLLLMFFGCMAI